MRWFQTNPLKVLYICSIPCKDNISDDRVIYGQINSATFFFIATSVSENIAARKKKKEIMLTRHALDTQNQIQSNIAGITWTEQDKVLNKLQITTVP